MGGVPARPSHHTGKRRGRGWRWTWYSPLSPSPPHSLPHFDLTSRWNVLYLSRGVAKSVAGDVVQGVARDVAKSVAGDVAKGVAGDVVKKCG